MKEQQELINKLIRRSFPKLRKKGVKLIKIPMFFSIGTILRGIKKDYIFYFGKAIEKKSKKSLTGFFVHELCHLEYLQKFSPTSAFIRYNLLTDPLIFMPWIHKLERAADIDSIKKGYAKNICENVIQTSKKYPKWIINYVHSIGYFSPQKIKSYAKSIGKW